ncbi:MAG: hypothetical protein ABIX46_07900 [Burkholderiaceae bacterium]
MMRARCATPSPSHPMTASTSALRHCLGAAALWLAVSAQAADLPRGLGDGTGAGPLLTREQLRECVAELSRIEASHAEALKAHAALDAEHARLSDLGKQITDEAPGVDLKNVDAVAAYNAKVQAREQQADAYAAKAARLNAQGVALQAQRGAFLKNCDNRRFDARDAAAVGIGK